MADNRLRRLVELGLISPETLTDTDRVNMGEMDMPQPRYDIAPVPDNAMRVENGPNAGRMTSLDFRGGTGGLTWEQLQRLTGQAAPAQASAMAPGAGADTSVLSPPQNQPGPSWQDLQDFMQAQKRGQELTAPKPSTMRVVGAGNGMTIDLTPEQVTGPIALDYTRPAVDVPGVGKAYYSKDGRGAYVLGADGQPATKVLLGYDDAASRARNKENLDADVKRENIAQSQAGIAHTQEQIRASKANNPDLTSSSGAPLNSNLTGDAFLKQLDPMIANEVKALAKGDTPFNPRSQRQMNLLGLVQQYDPTWSASRYNEKNATMLDFSPKGKSGQAIQAINQALHHAGTYADAVDRLNNSDTLPAVINPLVNTVEQKLMGDTRQGDLATSAMALSEELRKVYAGGGGGSLAELQSWQKSFDPNAGKAQQLSYLRQGMDLLQGALASRKEAYERGMGSPGDFEKFLSPESQKTLARLSGNGGPAPSGSASGSIPSGAIRMLRQNPGLRAQFEAKYGPGSAAQALGR